jgi:cell division protein FtsB
MTTRRRMLVVLVGMLMAVTAACSDDGALRDAEAEIEALESTLGRLEETNTELESNLADLEGDVSEFGDLTASLEAQVSDLESENETLDATLAETARTLLLQADIVGEGCMLQNAYLNDGERKATFRVRVYDPSTGEQMGEDALESVVVSLSDGQSFDLSWGPHPPDTENDFFWTYGWEIFAGYPAGNVGYTITATALDGRTGEFEPFNVAPSLLTVLDADATEEA